MSKTDLKPGDVVRFTDKARQEFYTLDLSHHMKVDAVILPCDVRLTPGPAAIPEIWHHTWLEKVVPAQPEPSISPLAGRVFKYRSSGMLAIVHEDGHAYWVETGGRIYSVMTVRDWEECPVVRRFPVIVNVSDGSGTSSRNIQRFLERHHGRL